MSQAPKVHLIGISDAGLKSLAPGPLALVESAGFIAGGKRHLGFVGHLQAETFAVGANLAELAAALKARLEAGADKPLVVLASGDPLFFGIGRTLARDLGAESLEVHPQASAFQMAFARLSLNWDDAHLVSVHGRPLDRLLAVPPEAAKLGVFTDDKNTPAEVARFLMATGWGGGDRAFVLENLEGEGESRFEGSLEEAAARSFGPLNVMVALRSEPPDPAGLHAFGLPDSFFHQRKPEQGLITKAEIRALSLSKMRLHPRSVAWDIGAGSGSVAVEAARFCRQGRVWAVEKNAEDCGNVRLNFAKFGCLNASLVQGRAPEALDGLPDDPDAVFVGGSSGRMADILEACKARLRPLGSLVVNTVTLENTAEALEWYKASGLEWDLVQVQVSRRKPILDLQRLDALNPIFVFWGRKAGA